MSDWDPKDEEGEEEYETENTLESQSISDSYMESLRSNKVNGSVNSQQSFNPRFSTPLVINVDQEGSDYFNQNGLGCEDVDFEPSVPVKGTFPFQQTNPSARPAICKSCPQPPPEVDNVYLMLDPQLHPVPPDTSCHQSIQIFEQHKQLAHEFLEVQTEMAYLQQHMKELAERLSLTAEQQQEEEEIRKLENEKENLLQLHRNLKIQLELLKQQRGDGSSSSSRPEDTWSDGWVVVPHPT